MRHPTDALPTNTTVKLALVRGPIPLAIGAAVADCAAMSPMRRTWPRGWSRSARPFPALDPAPFPQATLPARPRDAALRENPRAAEKGDSAYLMHGISLAERVEVRQGIRERDVTAIGIIGSAGRMGQALALAVPDLGATLAGGIDAGGDPVGLAHDADVLVDFSSPSALERTLAAARTARTPILIGTTGLCATHHALIDAAAGDIAVLQTGNVSLGVTLLAKLVREAAARLGPDWDIEIAEMHHRHKVDAPSGTALLLGEAAAAGRDIPLAEARVCDRAGLTGARSEGTIGFASLRGGSVAGDHLVVFAGEGERIELSHRAENRAIFAKGAITAALWLVGKPAGRYDMSAVVEV